MKNKDQEAREIVPSRSDLPTAYHPCHNFLMVVPLPTITTIGTIILPEQSEIRLNEGHIVEKGPLCTDNMNVGDCVTWDAQSEYRMRIDDVPFILVKESSITMFIPVKELLPLTEGSKHV